MRQTTIIITSESFIKDIQEEFSQVFPFLKIEFQKKPHAFNDPPNKDYALPDDFIAGQAFKTSPARTVEITPSITVRELEDACEKTFGVYVQFYRKSGTFWLKVTMTDNWTMKQQNELGREISMLFNKEIKKDIEIL